MEFAITRNGRFVAVRTQDGIRVVDALGVCGQRTLASAPDGVFACVGNALWFAGVDGALWRVGLARRIAGQPRPAVRDHRYCTDARAPEDRDCRGIRGSALVVVMSGGVASPYDPLDSLQFSLEEVAAAVEEAHAFGRYVCAHAYTVEAITRAAHAGVRTIEHGNLIDDASAKLMARRACS